MRNRTFVALALAGALVFGACSNDDSGSEPVAAEPTPSPSPDPTCPLTGTDIPGSVDVDRPAVAVKIENSVSARPQTGLEDADLVYEEIVEGGMTRFMAIYHCGENDHAGPVRSARFDDPKLASPFTKIIAFSGANAIVEAELAARNMAALDENSGPAFFRDPPGSLDVHTLFVNSETVTDLAPKKAQKPPSVQVFSFGEEVPADARAAKKLSLNFTASIVLEWRWKGGAWKRWESAQPFMSSAGKQIGAPNVLVQQVRVDNSNHIVDSAGNPSPDISLKGTGKAVLFRDGKAIVGKWSIKKEGAPPVFQTKAGDPMPFAPGRIWIELVPSKAGAVKGSFSFK